MNEMKKDSFTGYEYREITVSHEKAPIYLDAYESFGWRRDEHFGIPEGDGDVPLHLRRDRKIMNKMELTRLQRNFEANMEEIAALERSKAAKPQIVALSVGVLGTSFMAGSVFAVTASPPIIWLCVLLAIPGFIGWGLPYFLYKRMKEKRSETTQPLIDAKYDEIYELCKKGSELLK